MDDNTAWDLYFLTIVGWQLHPGSDGVDLDAAVDLAERMMDRRREIWPIG